MKNNCIKQALFAEFLGSLFLLLVVNGVIIMFDATLGGDGRDLVITSAIAVPAILFVIIEIFGPISGAHFNPLVTLIMYFEKKISATHSFLYTIAQLLGGMMGLILSHFMFYSESGGLLFVSEVVRTDFTYFSEIIATFMLILTILILGKTKTDKVSFIIPLLVGANILATSSTMFANPQVTFARIFTNSPAGVRPVDGLVFILMQTLGTLLAYFVYRWCFAKQKVD